MFGTGSETVVRATPLHKNDNKRHPVHCAAGDVSANILDRTWSSPGADLEGYSSNSNAFGVVRKLVVELAQGLEQELAQRLEPRREQSNQHIKNGYHRQTEVL